MNSIIRCKSLVSRKARLKHKSSVKLVFTVVSDLEEGAVDLFDDFSVSLLRVLLDEKRSEFEYTFTIDVALRQIALRSSRRSESLLRKEYISRSLADSGEFTSSL
jgi:hypothetical protein